MKENFVLGATFTITQTSEFSVLYNVKVKGAGSGSFDRAVSSYKYDTATVPGVVSITPKFLYGLGLTWDTEQAIDVQAGAVMSLNGATVNVDMKAQTISNVQGWQGSAQVTYPKLTQPGRVALSPYIKTDFQLSISIFGQMIENAIVLTSQTNMGFDAQVLSTSQVVNKRSSQPRIDGSHGLSKRFSFLDLIKNQQATVLQAVRAAAAAVAAAQGKPAPTPTPNVCNAGSMRLNAIMNSKYQVIVAGKALDLINQPYKFGSQW